MKRISLFVGLLYLIIFNTDAQKSKNFYKFPTEENIIYDICFTHNGAAIGIADDKSIKVYSTETYKLLRDFKGGHHEQILSIDISNDSTLLVSGGKDSTVVIWDFKEGKLLDSLKCNGIITSVCISPCGHYVAYGGSDNKVFVYNIAKKEIINIFTDHTDDITSIAFFSDGKYIATSSGDKLINIYKNGTLITTLSGHKDWVRDFSFNPDGTKLISCSDDGKVIIWNISDIKNPIIINKSKSEYTWLLSVDFNQDNQTFALGDFKGKAQIINQFGNYTTNINSSINKILFKPNDAFLKIAVATRGKGALFILAKDMKNEKKKRGN